MKYSFSLFFLVLSGTMNAGLSTHEGEDVPHDPPLFVNEFFANCFNVNLDRDLDWRSIVDFIIIHTSWFVNSDVGACAANNPDVNDEADCWKTAFRQLLLDDSEALSVAEECVDQFVLATRAVLPIVSRRTRQASPTRISFQRPPALTRPNVRGEPLNSVLCPNIENDEFVEEVSFAVEEMIELPSFDTTLQNFSSVVAFVRKYVKCEEPTCDACNLNYVSERIYPAFSLQCNRCWPTRLAGLIRNTSAIKQVISDVVIHVGNNGGPETPPQFFNDFFAGCLMQAFNNTRGWSSVVDFIIHHTSWFDNSNIGSCSPNSRDLFQETRCWVIAYGSLISYISPLLQASRRCAIEVSRLSDSSITERSFRRYLRPSAGVIDDPEIRSQKLNSPLCPEVAPQDFLERFMENVGLQTTPGDFLPADTTLQDFAFVIEQVMSSYKCEPPICDQCTVRYSSSFLQPYKLHCNRCWSSRLAGMIKNSSPLKRPATEAASSFEN